MQQNKGISFCSIKYFLDYSPKPSSERKEATSTVQAIIFRTIKVKLNTIIAKMKEAAQT